LSTQHRKKRQWNGQSFGSGRFLLAVTAAFVLLALGAFSPAAAQEPAKPLFELGIAGGAGYVPDYPAADQSHLQYLALPYFAYRGKFLRSDEKGLLRGRFVRTRNVELDVSLSGSFAIDSDDNDARRGMPDLDYLGEVGPRLQITIARAARHAKIDLELPLRAVFSTGLSDLVFMQALLTGWGLNTAISLSSLSIVTGATMFELPMTHLISWSNIIYVFVGGALCALILSVINPVLVT